MDGPSMLILRSRDGDNGLGAALVDLTLQHTMQDAGDRMSQEGLVDVL